MLRIMSLAAALLLVACQPEAASAPPQDESLVQQEVSSLAEGIMDAAV
jgi:hypothetical protein